jgi:hypothetical protein
MASAGVEDVRYLTGSVFIRGNLNDVSWDDEGITRWEAEGDVYLRFTSDDGEIVELSGDELLYERKYLEDVPYHWVSLRGNGNLQYGEYSVYASEIVGVLEPLQVDVSSGVKFVSGEFNIACEALSLNSELISEGDIPLYTVNIPGDANATFRRPVKRIEPVIEEMTRGTLPLPVDFRPDFDTLTIEAGRIELEFDDNGLLGAYFPAGGRVETDSG